MEEAASNLRLVQKQLEKVEGLPDGTYRVRHVPTRKHSLGTSSRRRSALDSCRQTEPSVKKLIAPTRKSRELMRQISALDMSDPVYSTNDTGPTHPSNVYEDMSLGDLPEDMKDLISVASDPTATPDDGLDVDAFQASLSDLNNQSFSELSLAKMGFGTPTSPISKSIRTSITVSSTSSRSDVERSPRRRPKKNELDVAAHSPSKSTSSSRRKAKKEDLNSSIVSLDLEDAIFGDGEKRRSRKPPSRSDSRSSRLHNSSSSQLQASLKSQLHSSLTSRVTSNTDSLLLEAALALDSPENNELVQAAMHNSMQELRRTDELKQPLRSRSTHAPIRSIPEDQPSSPAYQPKYSKQRLLPSVSQIFPEKANNKAARRTKGYLHGSNSSTVNMSDSATSFDYN